MQIDKKKFNKIKINILKDINNPLSIHGIYPYRGKISALDADAIINQLQTKNKVLLDPFCGSGTITYEACKKGIKTIGVDINLLAIWLSKGKIDSLINEPEKIINEVENIIKKAKDKKTKKTKVMNSWSKKFFHNNTAKEIMNIVPYFKNMSDYTRASFLGAIALTARGCNHYKWTSSTVGKNMPKKRYINFYEKFLSKTKKHIQKNEKNKKETKCDIYHDDARKISHFVKPNSVDYIFTSPPYFDALDYTAYYARIIYNILNKDYLSIKKKLIQETKISIYRFAEALPLFPFNFLGISNQY